MAAEEVGVDQDYVGNKLINMGEQSLDSSTVLTPPLFAVNQSNYNPVGLQSATLLRISATSPSSVTGLIEPTAPVWKFLWVVNIGVSNITLTNLDGTSGANNQFAIGSNIVLQSNKGVFLLYDQTSKKWRADR